MFFSLRPGGKNRHKIIVGENSPQYAYSWIPISTHAEIDALQKVKSEFLRGKRRALRLDLMVVRLSKTGILNNAEPCHHCLKQLQQASYVNIKNVYYSTSPNTIVCKKFEDMVNSPTRFISSGYRHRMGLPRNVDRQQIDGEKRGTRTRSLSPSRRMDNQQFDGIGQSPRPRSPSPSRYER